MQQNNLEEKIIKRPWQGTALISLIYLGLLFSILAGLNDTGKSDLFISALNLNLFLFFVAQFMLFLNEGLIFIYFVIFLIINIIYLIGILKGKRIVIKFTLFFSLLSFLVIFVINDQIFYDVKTFIDFFIYLFLMILNFFIVYLEFYCLTHPFYDQKKVK